MFRFHANSIAFFFGSECVWSFGSNKYLECSDINLSWWPHNLSLFHYYLTMSSYNRLSLFLVLSKRASIAIENSNFLF